MKRSEIKTLPEYFGNYIMEVEDIELITALEKFGPEMFRKELLSFEKIGSNTYAENKWTVKQIIQHLADTERVFQYRALSIARDEGVNLPSFDENLYTETSNSNRRSFNEILSEFDCIRKSGLRLFQSFTEEMLMRTGVCSGKEISVAAIGFVLAGHLLHHYRVIVNKYLPLAE